jgi:hypothetical protein
VGDLLGRVVVRSDGHYGGAGGVWPVRAKAAEAASGIAAGVLGPQSYQGRWRTALLGLFLHFVIAYGAATVFFAVSPWMRFLVEHAVVAGVLYGVAGYFFMQRVVLPLSKATKRPFSWEMMWIGVAIHEEPEICGKEGTEHSAMSFEISEGGNQCGNAELFGGGRSGGAVSDPGGLGEGDREKESWGDVRV